MKSRRLVARWAVMGLAFAASACSRDSTGPSQADERLRSLFQTTSFPAGLSGFTGGITLPIVSGAPSECTYSDAQARFICTGAAAGGLTFERQFALYDNVGHPLTTLDWKAAAMMRTWTHLSGTITRAANVTGTDFTLTLTIDRREDMTMSGLLTSRRTLNGTASGTTALTTASGEYSTHIAATHADTTSSLVFDTSGQMRWPLGGTIASHSTQIMDGPSGPSSISMSTRITFNGTSVITIVAWDDFGSQTCTIDLNRTSMAPPVCS